MQRGGVIYQMPLLVARLLAYLVEFLLSEAPLWRPEKLCVSSAPIRSRLWACVCKRGSAIAALALGYCFLVRARTTFRACFGTVLTIFPLQHVLICLYYASW